MALVRYRVVGELPIRDAVTKQNIKAPDVVTLDNEPVPRKDATPLAATRIDALLAAGHIAELADAEADA